MTPSSIPALFKFKRRRAPWLVDQGRWQLRKFSHPSAHIDAIGIELLALQHRIEYPEIRRGVGATARDPLPVGGIAAGIGINQRVPEPALALAPVDQEMLDQEGGDHHPHPVVHHAGAPELGASRHRRWGSRCGHAARRRAPCGRASRERRRRRVAGSRWRGPARRTAGAGRTRASRIRSGISRRRLRAAVFGRGKAGGVPDLPRADLAEAQMRRQRRRCRRGRAGRARRCSRYAVSQKLLEPLLRGLLAGRPGFAQTAGPIGMRRLKLEAFERVASQCPRRRRSAFGAGSGLGGSPSACTRRQNGVNTRKPRPSLVRMDCRVPTSRSPAKLCAADSEPCSAAATARRRPMRALAQSRSRIPRRPALAREFGDDPGRRSLAQHQRCTARRQVGLQRPQRLRQPPARRAAERRACLGSLRRST